MNNELVHLIREAVDVDSLRLIVCSQPRDGGADTARRIAIRPIQMRGGVQFQASLQIGKQETHENIPRADIAGWLASRAELFAQVNVYTLRADVEFRKDRRGNVKVSRSAPSHAGSVVGQHDRQHRYLIPDGEPNPFLIATGIMTEEGHVRSSKRKKFRQINRYLEFVNDVARELPLSGRLRVMDFGCGSSYLTFALHHLLCDILGRDVQMLGLDLKTDVIRKCQTMATELGCAGLEFREGDIASCLWDTPVHLAVSLHACDTATDAALARAVQWNASVILAVPCCHHELAEQLANRDLAPLLRHGILRERYATLATDALRSRLLEVHGYRSEVIEFIDTEHTPKNLMIRAVKRQEGQAASTAREDYTSYKRSLGVTRFALEAALGVPTGDDHLPL